MSISDKEKEALAKFAGWEVRDIPTAPWMGDGKTIYQHAMPHIQHALTTGQMPGNLKLLEAGDA